MVQAKSEKNPQDRCYLHFVGATDHVHVFIHGIGLKKPMTQNYPSPQHPVTETVA